MRTLLVALVLAAGGCGLISSDITNFDLALPDKTFTVDSANWGLTGADALLNQHCDPPPASDLCAGAATAACTEGTCVGQCNPTSQTCDLTLFISLYTPVDLKAEKPELSSIDDEPVISVTVDSITYTVVENTLNVDTPEMKVYAGPSTATRPGDPASLEVATLPPIPAGQTVAATALQITGTGRTNLARFMGDWKTPFNIVVGTSVLVHMGDQVPAGRLVVKVNVKAHAGV